MSGLFDASLPRSLYPTLPNVFTMSLSVKTAQGGNTSAGQTADGYATARPIQARRRPANQDELVRANLLGADKTIVFSVIDDGSDAGFVRPAIESRITDEVNVQWTVKHVTDKMLETLFSCVCVQGW